MDRHYEEKMRTDDAFVLRDIARNLRAIRELLDKLCQPVEHLGPPMPAIHTRPRDRSERKSP